jgi:hypothetical protein
LIYFYWNQVSFSNFLHPEFLFNTYSTKEDVLKAIGGITHSLGDATRTYLALEHTHSVIYKAGNGERPDVFICSLKSSLDILLLESMTKARSILVWQNGVRLFLADIPSDTIINNNL